LVSSTKCSETNLHTGVLKLGLTVTKHEIMQKFLCYFIFFYYNNTWFCDIFQFLGVLHTSMSEEQLMGLSISVRLKSFSQKWDPVLLKNGIQGFTLLCNNGKWDHISVIMT
jgi:hypothetical protein